MVTKDGFAKILDFGLAKLTQPEDSSGGTQAADGIGRDGAGDGGGHGGLHVAGADARQAARLPVGPVLVRLDALRDGHGKEAFARATRPETMTAIIREEPEPLATAMPSSAGAAALDRRAVPRQGPRRALRRDARSRAGSRSAARGTLRGERAGSVRGRARAAARVPSAGVAGRRSRSSPAPRSALFATRKGAGAGRRLPRRHVPPRDGRTQARFAPDGQTIVYAAQWEGKPSAALLDAGRQHRGDSAAIPERGPGLDLVDREARRGALPRLRTDARGRRRSPAAHRARSSRIVFARTGHRTASGLAVIRDGKSSSRSARCSVAGSSTRPLDYPRFSPDGRQIAAIESHSERQEASSVVVFDVATGREAHDQLGLGLRFRTRLASADRRDLVFAAGRRARQRTDAVRRFAVLWQEPRRRPACPGHRRVRTSRRTAGCCWTWTTGTSP